MSREGKATTACQREPGDPKKGARGLGARAIPGARATVCCPAAGLTGWAPARCGAKSLPPGGGKGAGSEQGMARGAGCGATGTAMRAAPAARLGRRRAPDHR